MSVFFPTCCSSSSQKPVRKSSEQEQNAIIGLGIYLIIASGAVIGALYQPLGGLSFSFLGGIAIGAALVAIGMGVTCPTCAKKEVKTEEYGTMNFEGVFPHLDNHAAGIRARLCHINQKGRHILAIAFNGGEDVVEPLGPKAPTILSFDYEDNNDTLLEKASINRIGRVKMVEISRRPDGDVEIGLIYSKNVWVTYVLNHAKGLVHDGHGQRYYVSTCEPRLEQETLKARVPLTAEQVDQILHPPSSPQGAQPQKESQVLDQKT